MDTSTVYHIDTLDDDFAVAFDPALPWVFETDTAQQCFATEEAACAAQRHHRAANGFNIITGEKTNG